MTHDLAFLHTGSAHVDAFGALVTEHRPGLRVRHVVAEPLLTDARANGMSAALAGRIQAAMVEAASTGAPVVVCTCSTIGGAAEATDTKDAFVAMRIDRPMADQAVALGREILIVAALGSTLGPTRALLEDSARRVGTQVNLSEHLIEDAWAYFEGGDREAYYRAIAGALPLATRGFDAVVLAQASMAPAADRCTTLGVPILSSPRLGVAAALNRLEKATSRR